MEIFKLEKESAIGRVQSVDTATVTVQVEETNQLSKLQVNHMVVIRSSQTGQSLIGLVNKIVRKYGNGGDDIEEEAIVRQDLVKVTLIGTLLDMCGKQANVFKRTLESVPAIDAECFIMTDRMLAAFMKVIAGGTEEMKHPLCIGKYTLNDDANAWLDGNKLFQRHAVITGSTGSGKSYTVASLIEKAAKLRSVNAVLFDVHGEYAPVKGDGIHHYKIAGPLDVPGGNVVFLPYWLLTYEEMLSMILDRSDNNAPNQAMLFSRTVLKEKRNFLSACNQADLQDRITIDSPVPYKMCVLIQKLRDLDTEMVSGKNGPKQGYYYGKLARFIQRLEAKISDKRLNFMFSNDAALLSYTYMNDLCKRFMHPASSGGGIKIIDFSEVPSDILPLMVSLIARIIFSVQQWVAKEKLHPVALFCDEAHLYIPQHVQQSMEAESLISFERIAKEGRKYGVGLVVITQRPSEVNRTVLSQSNNFIAMRLTNIDDQNVIRRLLPDSLGNFAELLPILDIGEALVVGDASLLPSRIKVEEPEQKPDSATIRFWDKWGEESVADGIDAAVEALKRQSK